MRLCALASGKCRVANNVAKSLPNKRKHKPVSSHVNPVVLFVLFSVHKIQKQVTKEKEQNLRIYLSASCASKTCRFVWSRMTLMLTKEPMSSFLFLYRFNLGRNNDAIFACGGWVGVGELSWSSLAEARKIEDVGDLRS